MYQPNCGECDHRAPEGLCKVFKVPVSADRVACPAQLTKNSSFTCEFCGRKVPSREMTIFSEEGTIRYACPACAEHSGHCTLCAQRECSFESDPSPLPKIVQKRIQQGPMTSITQIKNPDRIAVTCAKGCPCYCAEDNACNRESNTCGNYYPLYL